MQISSVEFQFGWCSDCQFACSCVYDFHEWCQNWNEDKSNEMAKMCTDAHCTHLICKPDKYIYRLHIFWCVTQDLAYIPHLIHFVTIKPNAVAAAINRLKCSINWSAVSVCHNFFFIIILFASFFFFSKWEPLESGPECKIVSIRVPLLMFSKL